MPHPVWQPPTWLDCSQHKVQKPALLAGPDSVGVQGSSVDYASWPVKELRRFLTERGEDSSGCTEKSELVVKVQLLADRGPEGADELPQLPAGYMFDIDSGMYCNEGTGQYFDPSTQGYYSTDDQKWYKYDPDTQRYAEWPTWPV